MPTKKELAHTAKLKKWKKERYKIAPLTRLESQELRKICSFLVWWCDGESYGANDDIFKSLLKKFMEGIKGCGRKS